MGDGDGEGEGEGETKKHRVRFNSACNETHFLEREVSATSSSFDSSTGASSESTITDTDLTYTDDASLDLSPHSPSTVPGFDPNRIPSSVFSYGPANDWSIASNESLFSITMGNNSFSRDHGFVLYKSGELMNLDEVFNLPTTEPHDGEATAAESESGEDIKEPEPPPKKENVPDNSPNMPETSKNVVEMNHLPAPDRSQSPQDIKFQDHCQVKIPSDDLRNSTRVSTQSDGSAASNSSFAFPILINQDTKNAPSKVERVVKDHTNLRPQQPSSKQTEPSPSPPKTRTLTSWFCCFSCCSFRCSMSLK